jgi:hypothetical protein
MTQHQLAQQLRDYKLFSTTVRFEDGRILKGYLREWFEPKWQRYIPPTDIQVVTTLQPAQTLDETQFSGRYKEPDVTTQKCEKPASLLPCNDVTTQEPVGGGVADSSVPLRWHDATIQKVVKGGGKRNNDRIRGRL